MKKFLAEFKDFAMRGNVMDLAVGVIIGGAFSAITTSLTVNGAVITYGNFIQAVLNFIIMALVVFCMIKVMNKLHRKKEEPQPPAAPPEPSGEEKLLMEIRDLLKENRPNA